jgi:hypothetical protein
VLSVLRKWKSGTEVKELKRTLRDSVAHLREDNVGKDRRIAELEARLKAAEAPRDTDRPETSPDGRSPRCSRPSKQSASNWPACESY